MKKIILILAAMLTFAACTKEGDVIYQTDPADAPSAKPLVTVIYDPKDLRATRRQGLHALPALLRRDVRGRSPGPGLSPHPHRERLYPPKLPRRSPGGIRFVAV